MSTLTATSSGGASQTLFPHLSIQPQQPEPMYPQLKGVFSNQFIPNIPVIPTLVSSVLQPVQNNLPSNGLYPDLGHFPTEVEKVVSGTPLHRYNFSPKINLDKKNGNFLSKIGDIFKKSNDREDVKKHYENMFDFVCNNFNALKLPEINFNKFNFNSDFQMFYKLDVSQLLIAFFNTTSSWPLSERIELFENCLKKCDEKIVNSNKESFKKFLKYDLFLILIVDRSNTYQLIKTDKEKKSFATQTASFFVEIQRLFPQDLILSQDKEFKNAICHLGFWGRLNLLHMQNAFSLAKAVENLYLGYFQTPVEAGQVDSYFAPMPVQPIVLALPLPSAPPNDPEPTTTNAIPFYVDNTADMPLQPQVVVHAPAVVQQTHSEVVVDDELKTDYPFDRKREPVNFKIEKEHYFTIASDLPWLNNLSLVQRYALLHNIQFPVVSGFAESNARENLEKRHQTKLMRDKYCSTEKWIEGLIHEVKATIISQRNELKNWGNSIVNGEISRRSEEGRKAEIRMWIDRAAQKGEIVDIGAFYRMTWKKGGRIENGDLDWGKNHAADSHELFSKTFSYFVEKGYLG